MHSSLSESTRASLLLSYLQHLHYLKSLSIGNPLITSSLPIEDEDPEYATDPELVEERFGWEVSLILDNGICGNGPTTIIDCTKEPFEIVRQGQGLI